MRKNILKMTLAAAFVCAAGFTAYRAQADAPSLSGLALENVEALANGETIGSHGTGTCYNSITTMEGSQILYCQTCTWIAGTKSWFSGKGKCD